MIVGRGDSTGIFALDVMALQFGSIDDSMEFAASARGKREAA
ncbi:hypothetical protein AB5I41_30220 [Sphingomonas sp. MMS24-JH45]